ncbi:MAG: hypothetical protein ACRDSK_07380 [Actinophytocola sp.]|uniref:hypothetical protein n=1 Tax=Actinophytocola sp. TaxID=1872138 RepID=UPI003D6B6DC9
MEQDVLWQSFVFGAAMVLLITGIFRLDNGHARCEAPPVRRRRRERHRVPVLRFMAEPAAWDAVVGALSEP